MRRFHISWGEQLTFLRFVQLISGRYFIALKLLRVSSLATSKPQDTYNFAFVFMQLRLIFFAARSDKYMTILLYLPLNFTGQERLSPMLVLATETFLTQRL